MTVISAELLERLYATLEPIGFEKDEDMELYINDAEYYMDGAFEWTQADEYFRLYIDIDEDSVITNFEIVNYDKERFTPAELAQWNAKLSRLLED